ncbi:MAG TPA: ABC transporter ATP-binding protein [Mycobacteriales bacterium]|nr:ABC transporter ATP-binding protein [Mycobacteriales bacterium]
MTKPAAGSGQVLLRATSLRVRRGSNEVLRDLDLTLAPGEVLAILGPNGAGKSTLLETIGNVLRPTAGSIERYGRVATAMQAPDLARRSARANVELALAWWGVPRRQRRSRALEALAAMRVEHLASRPAASMSGGERRRVHLARAVAIKPDILLLDEPFAGLDPASRAALLDDTSSAIRASARAVVLVVHDRAEAWALADRMIVMIDGRIAAQGAPRELLENPPTPQVARFLGFGGELRDGNDVLLTRPTHLQLDPKGAVEATILRLIPLEDGARAELESPSGRLSALVPYPGPAVGDVVRLRITGGVRFAVDPLEPVEDAAVEH